MGHSNTASDVEEITSVRATYIKAENAGDVEGILRTCTEDIVFIPPESPPVEGKEAAREFLGDFLEAFSVELDLTSHGVVVDGDLAYDWGTVSGTMSPDGGDSQSVSNTYLIVFERNDEGSWQQSKHVWNANG
jgi:uncharacterized protein (TIGR02246 family)